MLKENQELNVVLNPEQQAQIETANLRLGNLQNEIGVASGILSSTKNDLERVTKENSYQQGILKDTLEQIEKAKETLASLISEVEVNKKSLAENIQNSTEIEAGAKKKSIEFEQRENTLAQKEIDHEKKSSDFEAKNNALSEDRAKIDSAKSSLMEILGNIHL